VIASTQKVIRILKYLRTR